VTEWLLCIRMFQRLRKRSHNTSTESSSLSSNTMDHHHHPSESTATTLSEASPLLSTLGGDSKEGSTDNNQQQQQQQHHGLKTTGIPASLYVLSGVTQPLIMTLCKDAGLADSRCQLYMLFYYLGPASVGLQMYLSENQKKLPSWKMIGRCGGITVFDICAQALNYTGAALAGPTIFSIVYSSVTVWTAVFSRIVLRRTLLPQQWLGVWIVFGGLALTATDHSVQVGSDVAHGLFLVMIGSAMHGFTYVLCEVVMVLSDQALASMPRYLQQLLGDKQEERLTVVQNCAIQGFFAVMSMLVWQLVYTMPRWDDLILGPAQQVGTTLTHALTILGMFTLANLIHSLSYFFTLRHFPGGATSAGVMKGLQAVLVFVVTDYFFCGRSGGSEMCFSTTKLASLVTVVGGVLLFGVYTEKQHRREAQQQQRPSTPDAGAVSQQQESKQLITNSV